MNQVVARLNMLSLFVAMTLLLSGCGDGEPTPELVKVSGTITLKGKPLEDIRVEFMPNGLLGNTNVRSSIGKTDASGRYELVYQMPGNQQVGCAVGPHVVVLSDLQVNDIRKPDVDQTIPSRIRWEYQRSTDTKIKADVKPGKSAIFDFDLE